MGENASDTETYDAQMIKSVAADGDATAFMTDHFSLYVTADTEEIICYEVNFYYKDAEEKMCLFRVRSMGRWKSSRSASSAGS